MNERIKQLEDYLRRYPTGNFAELAQLELDRELAREGEKRIQAESSEGNPFTRGSAEANVAFKVGDSYQFRVLEAVSKAVQQTYTTTITQISDSEVTFSDGRVTDLLGNTLRRRDGLSYTPNQTLPLEYAVGKRWDIRFIVTAPNGTRSTAESEGRVVARERITVPAGTFDAFKFEIRGHVIVPQGRVETTTIGYRAPELVRVNLVFDEIRRLRGTIVHAERTELVSYKQS